MIRKYDVILINAQTRTVHSIAVASANRERAEHWQASLEARSSGHLLVRVVKAGEFAAGEAWTESQEEEE